MDKDVVSSIGDGDLNVQDYFMALCCLAAERSKDPCTQVGACVVDSSENLLGTGYNGMPNGCHDDEFPWDKGSDCQLQNKHLFVCHAEMNAIANSNGNLNNCSIYVTLFPCNECAKLIIQHGIKQVIYLYHKHNVANATIAAKIMFDAANVKYRQYQPTKNILLRFAKIAGSRSNM